MDQDQDMMDEDTFKNEDVQQIVELDDVEATPDMLADEMDDVQLDPDDMNMFQDMIAQVMDEEDDPNDKSIIKFRGHTDSIFTVAASPKGPNVAVTGSGDDVAWIWNLQNGEGIFELKGHTDSIIDVKFNSTGDLVATAGMDGVCRIWSVADGSLQATLEGPDEFLWIHWHPKGNIILGGAQDGSAYLWMSNGTVMKVYSGHTAPVTCGGFTPDGKTIVTASEDCSLIIWDPKTGDARYKFKQTDGRFHQEMVTSIAFYSDSHLIASASADQTVKLINVVSNKILASFDHPSEVEHVAFCSSLPLLASGCSDGKIFIFDIQTLRQRHSLTHDGCISKLIWHPTQPFLYSCSVDRTAKVWDARTGQLLQTMEGAGDAILDMALNSNTSAMILVGDDHTARVYQLQA